MLLNMIDPYIRRFRCICRNLKWFVIHLDFRCPLLAAVGHGKPTLSNQLTGPMVAADEVNFRWMCYGNLRFVGSDIPLPTIHKGLQGFTQWRWSMQVVPPTCTVYTVPIFDPPNWTRWNTLTYSLSKNKQPFSIGISNIWGWTRRTRRDLHILRRPAWNNLDRCWCRPHPSPHPGRIWVPRTSAMPGEWKKLVQLCDNLKNITKNQQIQWSILPWISTCLICQDRSRIQGFYYVLLIFFLGVAAAIYN